VHTSIVAIVALLLSMVHSFAVAAGTPGASKDANATKLDTSRLSARQAGARFGQAAGVELICYDLRTTNVVNELRAKYQDGTLAEFDDEAAKILAAWKSALSCRKATGPNECRLSHLWSCQQAWREIGPEGTAVPGLIEPKKP